jgi:hypothetical protein
MNDRNYLEVMPNTAMSVIELFNPTKDGITAFVKQVVTEVKNGNVSALRLKLLCKTMESISEKIDKETRQEQINEASSYGDKPFDFHGAEIHLTSVKTEYDYAHCGDPEFETIDSKIKELTKQRKEREEFLKRLTKSELIVDQNSGELVTIKPPVKKQTDGVKVTIK